MTLIRTAPGFQVEVTGDPDAEGSWIEAVDQRGTPLGRIERREGSAPLVLRFAILDAPVGDLRVRIGYASGEVWQRVVSLP